MARKKKKAAETEEEVQGGKKKKKGKKKLLAIPLALILVAAVGFAVVRFVLPKMGGGGEEEEIGAPPKKGIEAYTIGEDTVPSLDTILEEGEGELIANRGPGKVTNEEGEEEEKYTYLYELESYSTVMDRYLDLLMGAEQNFKLVDETYLILEERPELGDEEGALLLVRASTVEGHLFQLAIGWSQANNMLAVRVAAPEGSIRHPEPEEEPQPASLSEQLATIQTMNPSELDLPGRTMDQYEVLYTTGFVKVDDMLCRRFYIYEKKADGKRGDIVKIIYFSGDQQHMFQQESDEEGNVIITELVT